MSVPTTRRERLEEREGLILNAARDAFLENGFEGAKMALIARKAKVAEGTVYLYFKNKDALLEAVIRQFYEQLTQGARDGVEQLNGTFERFEFLARHHLIRCLENWQILNLMVGLYRKTADYDSPGYLLNKAYVEVFDSVFREGVARGELSDDLILWVFRDLFYGTLEYTARTLMLRSGSRSTRNNDLEAAVTQTMEILERGVSAQRDSSTTTPLEALTLRLENAIQKLESRD